MSKKRKNWLDELENLEEDLLDEILLEENSLESKPFIKFGEYYQAKIKLLVRDTVDEGWYGELFIETLEIFFDDLVNHRQPRLIIQTPPQHMKSTKITIFLSYITEYIDYINCIYTSYSKDLVIKANGHIRHILQAETHFKVANSGQITFPNNANLKTVSIFGGLTGTPCDFLGIDDPVKGGKEARSKTQQDNVEEIFNTTLQARLSAWGGWILILTRWHKLDLAGRILALEKEIEFENREAGITFDKSKIVPLKLFSYPAIATHDEYHPRTGKLLRKLGEALMPKFKPLEWLKRRKRGFKRAEWEAVYQQNPIAEGNTLIDVSKISIETLKTNIVRAFIVADTAYKDGEDNDYTCFACYGETYINNLKYLFLLDNFRLKVEGDIIFAPLETFLRKQLNSDWCRNNYRSKNIQILIEDKSSGITINQTLKRNPFDIDGIKYSSIPIDMRFFLNKSKQDRTLMTLPYINTNQLRVADINLNYREYLDELGDFTMNNSHAQDGYVDINTYAMMYSMKLNKIAIK